MFNLIDFFTRIQKIDSSNVPFGMKPRSKFMKPALPSDLVDKMKILFVNPASYWLYHIRKFYLRFKPDFQKILDEKIAKIQFTGPIVGLHIRRTDKIMVKFMNF